MTEKRFISEDNCQGYYTEIIDNEKELDLSLHNPKKNLTIEELIELLNEQNETITRLKKDFDSCSHNWALMYDEAKNKVEELSKENKQLKHELKLLAEFNQKATL
ncbi:hypothetical protein [Methanobrevibacter sp.]|uniref:hypothetical protein n=1 Tax=Methanobrevibacter sp. TaxID=66852 RepID=UPI00386B8160